MKEKKEYPSPDDIFDRMSVNEPRPESVAYTPSTNIIGMRIIVTDDMNSESFSYEDFCNL